MAETAERWDAWSSTVVTAHIIELRAGEGRGSKCLLVPTIAYMYHSNQLSPISTSITIQTMPLASYNDGITVAEEKGRKTPSETSKVERRG